MKMILVSLFDAKANTWSPPKPCDSTAAAIREFSMLVNDTSKTLVSQHPADFDLYKVGEWQMLSEEMRPTLLNPDFVHLANGIDVKVHE